MPAHNGKDRPPVDARLSADGRHIICGRCQEHLAVLLEPGTADYGVAVMWYGRAYPLYRFDGFVHTATNVWHKSPRSTRNRGSAQRRPAFGGKIIPNSADLIVGWGNPHFSGRYKFACPRTSRCGRINIVTPLIDVADVECA